MVPITRKIDVLRPWGQHWWIKCSRVAREEQCEESRGARKNPGKHYCI